ncbi:MAG: hypothetical protein IT374_07385 [Polyangiaceae bacterium]|nr:hypothetical protein [Polyangiaceae bacterium]
MRTRVLLAAWFMLVAGCDKGSSGAGPGQRGAPPPPAATASAKAGGCASGGGEVKDSVAAAFFPRALAGYCVNPDGETQAFGEKAPKPIDGICSLFDGGCELYRAHQVKRTVRVDYVDGGPSGATVTVDLSQFASADHAYAMFTKRVTSDEDPTRPDMPKRADIGAPAAMGTGSLYAWKGAYLVELSYVSTGESGDEKKLRESAERVLPGIAKGIVDKLPGPAAPPAAVAKLPAPGLLPLGVVYSLDKALGEAGTGPAAFGFYREGDKRYRVMVISKDDAAQAKDVQKTLMKKKGTTEEKALGEAAARLMVQEGEGAPKAEWIVARAGKLVVGVGDEAFALSAGATPAETAKTSLPKDEKITKVRALLDAVK